MAQVTAPKGKVGASLRPLHHSPSCPAPLAVPGDPAKEDGADVTSAMAEHTHRSRSPLRTAPAPYPLSENSPGLLGPRDVRVAQGNLHCHRPGDQERDSHAREMGMGSSTGSAPLEHPHHPLTFSPFRPGGPAGPRGPGSPGRPCKRAQLSPGCSSALVKRSHRSPAPLSHPCWPWG